MTYQSYWQICHKNIIGFGDEVADRVLDFVLHIFFAKWFYCRGQCGLFNRNRQPIF